MRFPSFRPVARVYTLPAAPLCGLLTAALFTFWPFALSAQSASFLSALTVVSTDVFSPLSVPYGVTVDTAGNLYIADSGNGRVVEIARNGKQTTLASGFGFPTGVAVDAAGNLFVADYSEGQVVRVSNGGKTVLTSGVLDPEGIVVDASDNVFVTLPFSSQVIEVPGNGGPQTTVGSNLSEPIGIALDPAGNLFIADYNYGQVVEIANGHQTTVATGLSEPYGIAVDASDNVYLSEPLSGTILKIPVGSEGQAILWNTGLNNPFGMAIDNAGNLFVADSANSRVVDVQTQAVNFGAVNVCPGGQNTPAPCSRTVTLLYSVLSDTDLSGPNVVTGGQQNLDFRSATSTCSGVLLAGSQCMVTATFIPTAPGEREGAVELTDSGGHLQATTYIFGAGQGPAVAFSPAAQTMVPGRTFDVHDSQPNLAMDSAGNLYVSIQIIIEYPANGGTPSTLTNMCCTNGFSVDGAGNIYGRSFALGIVKVSPSGSVSVLYDPPLSDAYIWDVAVDQAGNVFLADIDPAGSKIIEISNNGVFSTAISGLQNPYYVAVDALGNIYVVDGVQVWRYPPGGGAPSQVAVGVNAGSIALDAAGDIFIVDGINNRVVEVPADGSEQLTLYNAPNPVGIAVDQKGNLFVGVANQGTTNNSDGWIEKISRATPPPLSFATTPVGSTSSDSPKSVTAQNIGNQTLSAVPPGLTIGANFTRIAGSGTPPDCDSSFSLVIGASCNLSISFKPESIGTIHSAVVLIDNARNADSASQRIPLSGAGKLPPTPGILKFAQSSFVYATPLVFEDTLTTHGTVEPTGRVTLRDGATSVGTYPVHASEHGHVSGVIVTRLNVGKHIITAVYSGDTHYGPGTSSPVTLNITPGPVSLSLTCETRTIKQGHSLTCAMQMHLTGRCP